LHDFWRKESYEILVHTKEFMKAGSEFIALEEVFRLDCISNQGRYLYPTMIWPGNADYDAFFSKSFDDWFVWLEKE